MGEDKHGHLRVKIAFSGTADTSYLNESVLEKSLEIGREIVRQGGVLVHGATTGAPLWVARGTKEEGGLSIGLSPAASEREHVELYELPLEYMDFIIYTGFGYVGRDMLMTRTSDAVIIGPGRVGTIHEFTVAFEDRKPIGVFEGDWATSKIIRQIISESHREKDNPYIVYDSDPKALVSKLLEMVKKTKVEGYKIYTTSDKFVYDCQREGCENPTHHHNGNGGATVNLS